MEILPGVESRWSQEDKRQKMHQAADPGIQHTGCGNNTISACYGISEGSSDEEDYNVPVDCEDCMCCVCGEHFPYLDQLMEHLKTHKGQLFCHLCTANFDRAVSLALHLKNAHPKYRLFCTVCHVSFKSTWHLNEHLEKHYQKETKHEEKMDDKPLVKLEATENVVVEKSIMGNRRDNVFLLDHSYCVPVRHSASMESSRNRKVFKEQQARIHSPSTSCSSTGLCSDDDTSSELSSSTSHQLQTHFDEEYVIPGDGDSTDSAEDDGDALPPGDTEYYPDEDRSSESQCSTGSNTVDSKSSSRNCHRKTEIKKEIDSEIKTSFANHSVNPEASTCGAKIDIQTDSPNSKVAIKEENVNVCEEKPFVCCMCNAAYRNKDVLLKHVSEKHPTAVYICSRCLNAFTQQNTFQKHVCWKRPTSQMNIMLAATVPQLPDVKCSHANDPRTTSAPVLGPKSVEIQMIPQPQSLTPAVAPLNSTNSSQKITSVIPVGQTVTTAPQTTIPTQTMLVGKVSPSGSAKLTESYPQAVTVPQTLVRPPSVSVNCPNVPVCSPPIQRPSPPNQTRMTLRIPTPFNSLLQTQNRVIASFSPTVNLPILVSANNNKSIPASRQTLAGNIRPLQLFGPVQLTGNVRPFQLTRNVRPFPLSAMVQLSGNVRPVHLPENVRPAQLPGNVRPMQVLGNVRSLQFSRNVQPLQLPANISPILLPGNGSVPSASCPTLVSAILQKYPPHTSPAQVQSPTSGLAQTVGMYENKSSDIALQKRLKQTWSSKPIFPCRHCGAVSRQPSLRVRHRYLHRGSRLYRCQCGRSFQRQIHLLRHQVQHAEAVRFVCACCGRTFDGAHKLTRHKLKSQVIHRQYAKTQCIAAFECTCGRVFTRPSVLLWHVLKNTKTQTIHKIGSALT